MRPLFLKLFFMISVISLLVVACAPTSNVSNVPLAEKLSVLKGSYQVANDFVLAHYYVENAVALTDMHAFVIRDREWEIPVQSQVLGDMTYDSKSLSGTFDLNLPLLPRGEFNDVDHNGKEDQGVQIFAVAYSPNLYGGPFSEGDDRSRGWPSYLASVKTDTEKDDEVIGGKLVIWAADENQQFPSGFGDDGLLFTADDPVAPVSAGYTVVDLDQKPFAFSQEQNADLTLYEPNDVKPKDFSTKSYTEAFDAMFEVVRKEYAFTDVEGKAPAWDSLYSEIRPRVERAEKNKDANAYYLALRDFTWAFQDGHVALAGGQYAQQDFQAKISGGYGFAIREFDDGRVFAIFVLDGGPAQAAGMQVGSEILEFNGEPITDAINHAQSYSLQSSEFALRYQKARYLLTAQPGEQAEVTFKNSDGSTQNVTLVAIPETQSFSRTSVYFGSDRSSLIPVDAKIISSGNSSIGYIRINSNADDLNLTIRLFERALQDFTTSNVAGVIIDMRYDTGGTLLGLAGFLTNQEISMGQLEYYSDLTGKFEPKGLRDKILPNQNQYQFYKTVLLVGQACFSACELEAYGFSQVPGIVVVGQTPTAGVEAETARGQFKMPEGFELTIPTGRMTLPDGSLFLEGQGVQPTLRVPVDATTAYASEDVVLQAGIDAVLKPLGAGLAPSGAPKILSTTESETALKSKVPFFEDIAGESYDSSAFSKPGTVTYSVPLTNTDKAIWSYVWCASDKDLLAKNFENIQLKFELDGKLVSQDLFNSYDVDANGRSCRLVYVALGEWPAGEHKVSTTATFKSKINDGNSDFEAGDYVLEYTVFMKP
ncbi:MAG: S41 family peptidase [Anaerolineales bacterium]